MIVAGPQRGGFETIFANFYLSYNEWWAVDWGQAKAVHEMRGIGVFLTLDQADLDSHSTGHVYTGAANGGFATFTANHDVNGHVLGRSVWCSGNSGGFTNDWFPYIGPVESKFLTGSQEAAQQRWCLVQIYGYHDSVYMLNTSNDTDEGFYVTNSTGAHQSFSKEKSAGTPGLEGVLQIDNVPATILFNGTAGANYSWPIRGRTDRTLRLDPSTSVPIATGNAVPNGSQAIAGFKFRGTQYTDAYTFKRAKCFITTMGINVGRFS